MYSLYGPGSHLVVAPPLFDTKPLEIQGLA